MESRPQPRARRLPPLSFTARLGLANSVLIVLVCVTQSWVLARRYLEHMRSQLTERGRTLSEHLADEAGHALAAGGLYPLHDLVEQARAQGEVAYVRFFDAQGLLLVSGGSVPVGTAFSPPVAGFTARGPIAVGSAFWEFQTPIVAGDSQPKRAPRAAGARTHEDADQLLGTVVVGMSLESLAELRRRTFGTATLFTSLFALAAVLAAVRLARAATRPLGALAAAADTVARGDFSVRVEVRREDEVGRLAHSFNAMLDSLEHSATLEQKMREMQEVTRLKSEFLATVSHELRTPLNVIIGYADMLAAGTGGAVTVEQAEMLDAVRRYSRHQLDLITNVLDFSRLVSGKVSLHVERFALRSLLAEIEALQRSRLRDRPLRLSVSVDPDVPELETDRIKLHEIVRNLVDNAIKFTPTGAVSLTARCGATRDSVIIEVADTGPGIGADDLHRIFDAFQQARPSGTGAAGGVGLGLSIVTQLVDRLGGRVTVESRLGLGSTFRVEVPRVVTATEDLALDALDEVARSRGIVPRKVAPLRRLWRRGRRALAANGLG